MQRVVQHRCQFDKNGNFFNMPFVLLLLFKSVFSNRCRIRSHPNWKLRLPRRISPPPVELETNVVWPYFQRHAVLNHRRNDLCLS